MLEKAPGRSREGKYALVASQNIQQAAIREHVPVV